MDKYRVWKSTCLLVRILHVHESIGLIQIPNPGYSDLFLLFANSKCCQLTNQNKDPIIMFQILIIISNIYMIYMDHFQYPL